MGVQKRGIFRGGEGWPFEFFSRGLQLRVMRKLSVILLLIGLSEQNKNRRKAIFNWAAKELFFLKGGGGYTHSGYHKTLSATIACDRTSCETET